MLAFLQEAANSASWLELWLERFLIWLGEHETQTSSLRNFATALGIFIGGGFALYKFVFEGAISRRLQPGAFASVTTSDTRLFIRVGVTVENIGKRKVKIDQDLTRLSVSFAPAGGGNWTDPETPRILKEQEHEIIRPGESVADQIWGESVSGQFVVARVEFYVTSAKSKIFRRSTTWMHREMVSLVKEQGTITT